MSSRSQVIEYYEQLINKIDILTEKQILIETNEQEISILNDFRLNFIYKIKQIQDLSIKNFNSKNPFGNRFCFFIECGPSSNSQSFEILIPEEVTTQYSFFFNNKIGNLVVVNQFLSEEIVKNIK